MKSFVWLVRREFWEHRGGFVWTPLIVAAVFLAFTAMGLAFGNYSFMSGESLGSLTSHLTSAQYAAIGHAVDMTLMMNLGLLQLVMFFVLFFYLLGAIYDERKDGSILFWKSMPVSDTNTVLSKVVCAAILVPLVTVIIGAVMIFCFLGLVWLFGTARGFEVVGVLLSHASPWQVILTGLAGIPVGAIWALPCIGWLLLCSAFVRKAPFLWATLLPVGAGILISWLDVLTGLVDITAAFWKHVVARLLLSIIQGSWIDVDRLRQLAESGADQVNLLTPGAVTAPLTQPGTWIGAAVGVLMIAAVIYRRRWGDNSA